MAIFLYIALLLIGILLAFSGGVVGLVQAFQESATWGLLYLLVPFASLVFLIKFWSRQWVRRSLWLNLAGVAAMIMGLVVVILNPNEFKQAPFNGSSDGSAAVTEGDRNDPDLDALMRADQSGRQALEKMKQANNPNDWAAIMDDWQAGVDALESIPTDSTVYEQSRPLLETFKQNRDTAQKNAK
jgi:uncharacterized membrane protein